MQLRRWFRNILLALAGLVAALALLVAEMDTFNVRWALLNVGTNPVAREAVALHPDRFVGGWDLDVTNTSAGGEIVDEEHCEAAGVITGANGEVVVKQIQKQTRRKK